MKVFLVAPNIAFGISILVAVIVKKIASIANANRQQITGHMCASVGECLKLNFELSSRRLVLAPCNLYRLLVNLGNTWAKQKGHILNPPINTEAEHAIKRLLTLFRLGKNTSLGAKNMASQKEVVVSERWGQEGRQQRSWLEKTLEARENPRDQRCMETNECQGMLGDPGQWCPRLVTIRRCTAKPAQLSTQPSQTSSDLPAGKASQDLVNVVLAAEKVSECAKWIKCDKSLNFDGS